VEEVIGVHSPPVAAIVYAFQIPVLFDENRIRDSSDENDVPLIEVVLRNCSMVYCFGCRGCAADCFAGAAAWAQSVVAITVTSVR
jgi:hypothetical protein